MPCLNINSHAYRGAEAPTSKMHQHFKWWEYVTYLKGRTKPSIGIDMFNINQSNFQKRMEKEGIQTIVKSSRSSKETQEEKK